MSYADPIKQKEYDKSRYPFRKEYWREYHRKHKQNYIHSGESLGYKAEELSLSILKGSKRIYHPTDLSWNGKLVDVKTGIKHLYDTGYKKGKTYYWKFYLKQLNKADLFLFILQDANKKVEKVLLVPNDIFKSKYLRIAENKIKKYSDFDITLL